MTAFVPADTSTLAIGRGIQFNDVKFSVGIRNISTFKNTGKFMCEKTGLYIVSVSMEMNYDNTEFYGKEFTKSSKHNNGYWHSASVLIAIELKTNDTVWLQIGNTQTKIRGDLHSRFTIIKIH